MTPEIASAMADLLCDDQGLCACGHVKRQLVSRLMSQPEEAVNFVSRPCPQCHIWRDSLAKVLKDSPETWERLIAGQEGYLGHALLEVLFSGSNEGSVQ